MFIEEFMLIPMWSNPIAIIVINLSVKKHIEIPTTMQNGQLILMLGKRVAYAWYCCGLDREYHDLYPSIMANDAVIRYAAENGFERYDMMGAGTPKEDYGVRDFKAQFGGALVEHGRFIFVCRPVIYNLGKIVINILTKQHNQ